MANIVQWVRESFENDNISIFERVYVIGGNTVFTFYRDGNYQIQQIEKEIMYKLKWIGRMTAEGKMTLDDEEWN